MKRCLISLSLLLCLAVLTPVCLLAVNALIPAGDAALISSGAAPLRLLPIPPSGEQFARLFTAQHEYWRAFRHSLAWTAGAALTQAAVSLLSGYVLAKRRARWCAPLVLLYTLMMLMPLQMTLLPHYHAAKALDLPGALRPLSLYLPIAFAPFGTFLMRQLILRTPDAWAEFLRLEGGTTAQLLRHVLAPACSGGLLLLFLMTFAEGWSMVEQPLILAQEAGPQPLSMVLDSMRKTQPTVVFAAAVMAVLPAGVAVMMRGGGNILIE